MIDGTDKRYGERCIEPGDGDVATLLIHGVPSVILSEPIIGRMRQRKPCLEIVSIGNRGHAPLLDEQEAIHAIATFL